MNRLHASTRSFLLRRASRDVPLAQLRHDDRPVYVSEGYGGQPIGLFPPCRFFRLHEEGRSEEAFEAFCAWYHEQFRKYARVPKRMGGMWNGTLHRALAEVCREAEAPLPADPAAADGALLERAIERRVEQRFALLRAIRDEGYQASLGKPVLAWRRGQDVVLTGGHHRAAALEALGRSDLPAVSVFDRSTFRSLKRLTLI